jgi:hypothetical protein
VSIEYLYKYGQINKLCEERTEKLFTTPTLWFPSPAALNDPFECRPWVTGDGTREQVMESFSRMLRKKFPDWTEDTVSANAASWYLERRHRHPEIWKGMRKDLISVVEQSVGLYCLSEVNDEILMWSHYADEHRGFCLIFEATDSTPVFGAAQRVSYSKELPDVDVFCDSPHDAASKALLTKYCGWSYEKEWRIVDHEFGAGHHDYPVELLSGVIFGARMPNADRAKIQGWLLRRGHEVQLQEAIQSERHFKVEVRVLG